MCRVLIVDDDIQQLSVRKLLLEAAGHQVAIAHDCIETRRLLEEICPEVLVIDLRLPELEDGLGLIRSLYDRQLGGRTIVLSGWTELLCDLPEEKMVACVLGKPVRNIQLLEAINEAVSSPARSLPSGAS